MAQPTPITPSIYTTASVLSKNRELQSVNQTIAAMKVSLGDLGVSLSFTPDCGCVADVTVIILEVV